MQNAFVIVVIAVGVIGVLGAVAALASGRSAWESIGSGGLTKDSDGHDARRDLTPAGGRHADPARDDEIRQLLRARNARRERHGQPPLDIEAELARLTEPATPGAVGAADEQLRAEIRELVIARNARRARRGRPPLDVEAEVEREVGRMSG